MTRTGGIMSDHRPKLKPEYVKQELPDAKKHQQISFIKSAIRIVGYVLIPFNIGLAVTFLVVSEAVGIIEELV